jgi:hypothetical protein
MNTYRVVVAGQKYHADQTGTTEEYEVSGRNEFADYGEAKMAAGKIDLGTYRSELLRDFHGVEGSLTVEIQTLGDDLELVEWENVQKQKLSFKDNQPVWS